MFSRTVVVPLTALLVASFLKSSNAFCKRPEEVKTWKRKSLTERAKISDIVVYGKVISSPCWKPGYVKPTVLPTTAQILSGGNSSNVTSNATASTPQVINATMIPSAAPPYNCSSEYYSAIIKVICVVKGGSVPLFIWLEGFGHGDGVCLDESFHDYHAYNNLNYLIFMGRNKNISHPRPFWINPVNHQPAITEITDESMLEPIFEAAGRNAHMPVMPVGVGSAIEHAVCKPYVSSAHVRCSAYASLLMVLAILSVFVRL